LGGTRSRASIFGFTTVTVPGEDPFTDLGGLLAQPTNIGRYSQSGLSAIPEVGLTTAYDLTSRWRAKFGYTLLYWSRVARPGDEIDAGHVAGSNSVKVNVNPTQFSGTPLTGVPSPQFRFVTTDFWAQGLSLGLDCRF
jgi:dienelactone hydrolase